MLHLFTIAFAQGTGTDGGQASQANPIATLIPIGLMIVIFYFLLIRPQQKKEKDRKKMISDIKEGDRVLTVGGMYGIVSDFKDDNTVVLKVSGNTKIEFAKSSIQSKV